MSIKSFLNQKTRLISHIDRASKLYVKHRVATVLDLGSGTNPHRGIRAKLGIEEVLVDIYETPGVRLSIQESFLSFDKITKGLSQITDKTKVDCVVGLHIIEHVEKELGIELISQMEKWATKIILIETPNGFVHQDGHINNPLQRHICGYSVAELRNLGFKVRGTSGMKFLKHDYDKGKYKWDSIWVQILDRFLSKVCHLNYFPEISFNLFAYKVLDPKS